jgi:hypothetical protein
MPEETGRIGKIFLEENDPYRLIGDQLFEKWKEEEFADLYKIIAIILSRFSEIPSLPCCWWFLRLFLTPWFL